MGFLTKPAVQGYFAPGNTAVGPSGYIDRTRGRVIGFYNFDIDAAFFDFFAGTNLSTQNLNTLGVFTGLEQTAVIDSPDGKMWCFNSTGPVLEICRIDPAGSPAWTFASPPWGSGSVPTGIVTPYSLAWLQVGNGGWIVSGELIGGHIDVLQASPGTIGFWGHHFLGSTTLQVGICAGPQGAMSSKAYWAGAEGVLGSTVILSTAALYNPATWPTPNGGITSAVIKTYAPTDFDAAWGAITDFNGPAYDSTDGNVVVQVVGTGGGNPYYIAKLNTTTGAVIWKVPVANNGGFRDGIQFSRIQNGRFLYYAQVSTAGGTVYAINTGDGSFTTQATTGLTGFSQQSSDDVLGCIVGQPSWDASVGNLLLLNATPTAGNTFGAVYFIESENEVVQLSAISYTRMFGVWQQ